MRDKIVARIAERKREREREQVNGTGRALFAL